MKKKYIRPETFQIDILAWPYPLDELLHNAVCCILFNDSSSYTILGGKGGGGVQRPVLPWTSSLKVTSWGPWWVTLLVPEQTYVPLSPGLTEGITSSWPLLSSISVRPSLLHVILGVGLQYKVTGLRHRHLTPCISCIHVYLYITFPYLWKIMSNKNSNLHKRKGENSREHKLIIYSFVQCSLR